MKLRATFETRLLEGIYSIDVRCLVHEFEIFVELVKLKTQQRFQTIFYYTLYNDETGTISYANVGVFYDELSFIEVC